MGTRHRGGGTAEPSRSHAEMKNAKALLKPAGQEGLFGWGLGSSVCKRLSHHQSTAGFHLVGFQKNCLPGSMSPLWWAVFVCLGKDEPHYLSFVALKL